MNIKDLIEVDPERMSGTPVFTGTRVPINHLFDYLKAGDSLDIFLTDFPTVKDTLPAKSIRAAASDCNYGCTVQPVC
jgi:uncharacterized protein (DUF433 family)